MYMTLQNRTLANEITDAEALAIVEAELRAIPATDLAKVVLGGFSDLTPISGAIKKSIEKICVKGAVGKVNNMIPIVIAVAVTLLIGWFIFK